MSRERTNERKLRALERRVRELERALEEQRTGTPSAPPPQAPSPQPLAPMQPRVRPEPSRSAEAGPPALPPPIPSRVPVLRGPGPAPSFEPSPYKPAFEPPPPPPREPREPTLVPFLRKIYLLPPEADAEGNLEQQLGAWWLTRIGGLLAVIALVFLGIYVSSFSTPLVRVVELLVISGAVAGLGLFLERRTPQFGRVLLAAGLAMFYFTAFSMYAIPGLKVVNHVLVAALLQAVAIIGVFGVAVWKRSQHMATMAVGFGAVSHLTALLDGQGGLALPGAFCLALIATGLYALRRWIVPVLAAIALLVVVGTMGAMGWRSLIPSWELPAWAAWIFALAIPMLAPTAIDLFWHRPRGHREVPGWRYALQTGSLGGLSGLAVFTAWWVLDSRLSSYDVETTQWVAWLFSVLLLGVAFLYLRPPRELAMTHMPLLKGSALMALGFVIGFDGSARWMALLLQAAILVFSAYRGKLRLLTVLVLAIWGAAVIAYLVHANQSRFPEGLSWIRLLFVFGSAATLAAAWHWAPRLGKNQSVILGFILGVVGVFTVGMVSGFGWEVPTAFVIGLGCLLIAFPWSPRQAVATLAPLLLFMFAHFVTSPGLSDGHQVLSAGSLMLLLLPAAVALRQRELGFAVVFSLLLLVWAILTQRICSGPVAVMVAALSGVAVLRIGKAFEHRIIGWLAALPLGVSALYTVADLHYFQVVPDASWQWIPSVLAAYGFAVFSRHHGEAGSEPDPLALRHWVHSAPALLIGFATAQWGGAAAVATLFALLGLASAGLVLARCNWGRAHGAAYLVAGMAELFFQIEWLPGLMLFTLALGLSVLTQIRFRDEARAVRRIWCTALGLAALTVGFTLFHPATLENARTVGWAATGLAIVVCGFFIGSFPLRIVGFLGLLAAIGRVFTVDVQDTFGRILAFAGLAVLFLALGYLYTRFKTQLTPRDGGPAGDPPDA